MAAHNERNHAKPKPVLLRHTAFGSGVAGVSSLTSKTNDYR